MITPASYSGYEGMGYQIYVGVFLLGLWSLLLFASMALSLTGIYRKYSGAVWKPFFITGAGLFLLLISMTFLDAKLYSELSGKGLFSIYLRSLVLLLPFSLILLGLSLSTRPATLLPGVCFIVAGATGATSCLPLILEPTLRFIGEGSPDASNWLHLSYSYLLQLSLIRILAETAGIIGIFSFLKHQKDLAPAISPVKGPGQLQKLCLGIFRKKRLL